MPTSESREKWLTCKLDRGMFSDEVAVTYPPTEHWQKSVFVRLYPRPAYAIGNPTTPSMKER
jgi:hypothetical protein